MSLEILKSNFWGIHFSFFNYSLIVSYVKVLTFSPIITLSKIWHHVQKILFLGRSLYPADKLSADSHISLGDELKTSKITREKYFVCRKLFWFIQIFDGIKNSLISQNYNHVCTMVVLRFSFCKRALHRSTKEIKKA